MSTVGGPRLSTIPTFQNTYSLDFDGVDDYVQTSGVYSELDGLSNTAFSFWMKTSNNAGVRIILAIGTPSGDFRACQFQIWSINGAIAIYYNGLSYNSYSNASVISNNVWTHVLITRDSSRAIGDKVRIYINGVDETSSDITRYLGTASAADTGLFIGEHPNGYTSPFLGNIDEVAIYNQDMAAYISEIYSVDGAVDLNNLDTAPQPIDWYRNGDNGSWKSPQFLLPNNSNKNKLSNYSFEFDGIDDVIPIRTMASMVGVLDEVSYSCWIRTSTPGVYQDYQCPFGGYSNAGAGWNIGKLGTPYNTTNLVIYTGGLIGTTILNDGNWHHIVSTFNKTTKEGIWYVDGNIEGIKTLPSYLTHFAISIGAGNGTSDYYFFNGNIDECSVWSNVLTQIEVTSLYNNGTPTDLTNLSPYGWYRMGEEANFTSNWLVDNSALDNYSKRSFAFDGIDDKIELGNPTDLQITGAFSFSCWVNTTSTNYEGIYFKGNSVALSDIYIRRQNNGTVRFFINNVSKNVTSSTTVNDGNWHHIMCVYVPSTSMTIYIDGSQDAQNTTTIPVSINNNYGNISIGEGGGQFFNGKIDEASIFNTVVDIADVWDGSGEPIDVSAVSGIVGNYRMGEDASFNGTNWTIPDNVGTNNGTSNAMTVDDLVGESPNYTGGGISEGMDIEDRVGNAPNSDNNTLSINMEREDRVEDTP